MGRMLTEPWVLGMIVVVAILLFSAPRLPAMARSLGQSMRIFKSEVRQMKDDVPVSLTTPVFDREARAAGERSGQDSQPLQNPKAS